MYRSASCADATSAPSVMDTRWCASYLSRSPLRISIVCEIVGSATWIGWNRRSRAASFSRYLRYSSSVVAPIVCSSPRARPSSANQAMVSFRLEARPILDG
jgi:hypothetical protein